MRKEKAKTVSIEINDKMTTEQKIEALCDTVLMLAKTVKGLQGRLNDVTKRVNINTENVEMLIEATSNLIDIVMEEEYDGEDDCEEEYCAGDWLVNLAEGDDEDDDEPSDEEPTVCPCCGNIE